MSKDKIVIRGARQHNLKNLNLEIPREKLVVVTGVSGSGKSSLAFDTLFAEGQRRYLEAHSAYARQLLGRLEAPLVDAIEGLSPAVAIEQKGLPHNPRSTVATLTEIYDYLRLIFARLGVVHCPECGLPIEAWPVHRIVREVLSAYTAGSRLLILAPLGPISEKDLPKLLKKLRRDGYARIHADGKVYELDPVPLLPRRPSYRADIVLDRLILSEEKSRRLSDSLELAMRLGKGVAGIALPEHPPGPPFEKEGRTGSIPAAKRTGRYFSESARCMSCGYLAPELSPSLFSFHHPSGACPACNGLGYVREEAGRKEEQVRARRATKGRAARPASVEEQPEPPAGPEPMKVCPVCSGSRLGEAARSVRLGSLAIHEVARMTPSQVRDWLTALGPGEAQEQILDRPRREILSRLDSLDALGLSYLTLDRPAATLSGGEAQRVRLAHQISSALSGVLYVLDEPSIGLHPRDHQKLLDILVRLRDAGNSVIVVEHDRQTILQADYVIDMGPGAGIQGGEIICAGTPEEIAACPGSLTGQYLSGKKQIPVPRRRKTAGREALRLSGARGRNLKNIGVRFPFGCITCVTGVSGSGKSTLVIDTLYPALARLFYGTGIVPAPFDSLENADRLRRVILVDQAPLGRTPRSTPATYTGVFGHIRQLFSRLPEARARGYTTARFSFNARGGRCEYCHGEGLQRIAMYFLPDVWVTCPVCGGSRYGPDTLEILYKGRSIASVLELTVFEAAAFFENFPAVRRQLDTLIEVGLGYIRLGQPATTLSGGEAQRVKLAAELGRRGPGRALYILDEPTTGLHFEDIQKLLHVLQKLADLENTVVLIEHNPDVIKTADYVIDLGPEAGDAGGYVVAEGAPEEIARAPGSHTGYFLRQVLSGK